VRYVISSFVVSRRTGSMNAVCISNIHLELVQIVRTWMWRAVVVFRVQTFPPARQNTIHKTPKNVLDLPTMGRIKVDLQLTNGGIKCTNCKLKA
jgi:hypothetical protein